MKKCISSLFASMFIFMSLVCGIVHAQEQSVISDSIYSDILQEQRSIRIVLPETYQPGSGDTYDVIYLTDGEWVVNLFPFIYKFAQDENYVPPAIIVAIPNRYIDKANQRDRDFLPVHVPQPAISGGADKFLGFLKNELMPYIDKNYPVSGINSLYGHSYGGAFVLYTLLTEPQLFDTYYATDPPFGWNDDYLIRMASRKLETLPPGKVFWFAGIESTYKYMGIDHLDSLLQRQAPESLHWRMATYPNEKHNSVRLKAMYDGIKFAHSGYPDSPLIFHPMNGILLKDKPVPIFLDHYTDVRYTLDGTEPDRTSPKFESGLMVTAPAQLILKSFSASGRYEKTGRGNFEPGEALPPVPKPENSHPGGVKYSCYEGNWEALPDFSTLTPVQTGIADSTFNLGRLPVKAGFACLFEGYIEIVKDGYYFFGLLSDNRSRFYLGDRMIIDYDSRLCAGNPKSFVLPLKKGFYPARLEYLQKEANLYLQLLFKDEEPRNPVPLPLKYQYYVK